MSRAKFHLDTHGDHWQKIGGLNIMYYDKDYRNLLVFDKYWQHIELEVIKRRGKKMSFDTQKIVREKRKWTWL